MAHFSALRLRRFKLKLEEIIFYPSPYVAVSFEWRIPIATYGVGG